MDEVIPITNTTILLHPSLLPSTADPQDSTRYKATIIWEQYPIEPHESTPNMCAPQFIVTDITYTGLFKHKKLVTIERL